ncbi:alpha/beta hydrolase [Staphylococcus sp. IVB6238]|uniref:alpha/beta hydrolase n=1 Tax=Staphylococcus sp. IVB6238 TaxID=2989770 RepID=UPI0021D19EAB|nr:alpha/beta hydrolase [Staphylococcus sp. IVB6238]UXR74747.1 alpha/beta hydrolase [Staphylococcus sp. IVB6238]
MIQKLIALSGYMFLILLRVILMGLTYNAFYPDTLTRASQDIIAGKVTGKTQKSESNDGTMYYKNIVYEQHQDNTVLDIYTSPEPKGTLFYIHGGGYAFDDKTYREQSLYQFVKQGYNVVNINYTLSPDAHYPDTLVQANQALSYVIKHAETYGIDPSKMIFSGDSVGAQVSGQLVLLLTNQSYAKELGIVPANVDNHVDNHMVPKGFISVSGLLDTPEVGNTQLFATDWLFETLIRSYFQTNDVAHSEEVMESSILNNVNKQFPPTFMSDGNFGSFTKQAQALHHKLKHLGVDSQLVVFDQSEALLFHVFELKVENSYAQKVHTAQLDFMASVLEQ